MARKGTVPVAVLQKPTKGVRPDMTGVAGELVQLDGMALAFGSRCKVSPYDALLNQLAAATDEAVAQQKPRPGLKFGDQRARASVYVRAKRMGLRVVFAIAGNDLYVRMDGRADDNVRESRRTAIKKLLVSGVVHTHIGIAAKLREQGDASVDGPIVEAILLQLMRTGEVIRQDGGAWKIGVARKAS